MDNTKQMPQAIEAENAVIGALMLDSRSFQDIESIVTADDFYTEKNRILFETISNKRSEAGKKSAELRKTLTGVQQVSASVQQNPTKERKGKKRKEKNIDIQQAENLDESYIKFNSWLIENAPIVSSLKTQMTEKQFLEIKSKYSSNQIINIINNIENYIPTPKKYRNVYLTFKKWAEKEYGESNNNITTKTIVYD